MNFGGNVVFGVWGKVGFDGYCLHGVGCLWCPFLNFVTFVVWSVLTCFGVGFWVCGF